MLRRNIIRIMIIFLALFILFAMLYSGTPESVIASGSLGQKQETNFFSYSEGLQVSIFISYDIPSGILSNVTITNHVNLINDISSNHSVLILNYSSSGKSSLFNKYLPAEPGLYSVETSTSVRGNPQNVADIMGIPSSNITFYVSIEMPKPLIFMVPMITFGIFSLAMVPIAVKFGKRFFE